MLMYDTYYYNMTRTHYRWPRTRPSAAAEASEEPTPAPVCRHWAWADLMRRAFDIDVLACPRCGGRLRLIATVEDPDAIRTILVAVAGSQELAERAPPFAPALNTSRATAIGV
jgi:hypothetical protein